MNIKYPTVISDIQGNTGPKILNAIVNGERNPEKPADLCDPQIKAIGTSTMSGIQKRIKPSILNVHIPYMLG